MVVARAQRARTPGRLLQAVASIFVEHSRSYHPPAKQVRRAHLDSLCEARTASRALAHDSLCEVEHLTRLAAREACLHALTTRAKRAADTITIRLSASEASDER